MEISKWEGNSNNTWVSSESRIFSENWVIEWSYAAFSLLFNVYIRSMHVKLLQTTFSDSHQPAAKSVAFPGASIVFKVSPNFPICPSSSSVRHCSHLPSFLGKNVWRDPVVAYATELSTWSTACCMRGSEPVLAAGSRRSVSNLCSCFRCTAKVFVLRVPALNLSLSSYTDALGILQPVVIIKVVVAIWHRF